MKRQKPDDKQIFIISLVGVITLIIVMIGATYAYFSATTDGEGNIDTNVSTSTTDNLSFAFGEEIHISATEENFAQGMPSLSDSTTGTALLRPNNYTNQASATYNIYLIIESNDFEYTTENQTPEILLKVTSPTGEEVQNITGLVHTADGFDITTRVGGFLIISDYEITATTVEEIQQWNIEVTFVNLNSDQQANTEKTLTAKLYMTQEQMSSYELIEINNIDTTTTYNQINATLDLANGTADPEKYYYGIEKTEDAIAYNESSGLTRLSNTLASAETVEYVESDSANYTFTELESNTEYTIYSYVVDTNEVQSNIYQTNVTTNEYNAATVSEVSSSVTLNSITLTVSASDGSNEIVSYMYSINNGSTWVTTDQSTYTFNDLTDSTTYHVMVKVVDSEGMGSAPYYEAITTTVYQLPVVTTVDAATTYNSITLTPTGTNGTVTIDHYLYSIDDGEYQESNVFSNLQDNTNYTIRVKAVDVNGRESNPYTIQVTTDEYINPTISEVNVSSTTDSITINVTAAGGTGSVATYHYSRDDGLNYVTSSSPNYTFDNLTAGVLYYVKVYVTDSNGRVSGEYNTTVLTGEPTLAYICRDKTLAECITTEVYTGTDGENNLYYHDGVASYSSVSQEAGDNSYRYSGPDYVVTDTYASTYSDVFGDLIVSNLGFSENATEISDMFLYYTLAYDSTNTQYRSLLSAINKAISDGYLRSNEMNNYVCFGSDAETCSEDNLYRIIGVFGSQVKLIKYGFAIADELGTNGGFDGYTYGISSLPMTYYRLERDWSTIAQYYLTTDVNNSAWQDGVLGPVNLNTNYINYLNGINSKWANMITTTTWQVGGIDFYDYYNVDLTAKQIYDYEMISPFENIEYTAKIGLMYANDYIYAASPNYWLKNSCGTLNWLYMGLPERSITRLRTINNALINISSNLGWGSGLTNGENVRQVFYLTANVKLSSGTGTMEDPFRIEL